MRERVDETHASCRVVTAIPEVPRKESPRQPKHDDESPDTASPELVDIRRLDKNTTKLIRPVSPIKHRVPVAGHRLGGALVRQT